ncbi:hypothetical protein AURDEDRAFT_176495 [Auricularia subglabra TFB-10046 SS5]|nr:hypothetical protein AURDEDRAFT_176495 [Auricularia subglabra TFB-10046 SS5]
MFHRLTLSEYLVLPPRSIISYARFLRVTLDDFGGAKDDYNNLLGNMPNLNTVYWQPRETFAPVASTLRILISPPSVTSFMASNASLKELPLAIDRSTTRLSTLDISQSDRDVVALSSNELRHEGVALERFSTLLIQQLEVLRIPGESLRLSFLASTVWPRLRELAIRGGAPLADAPLDRVLCAMPRLRILTLAVVRPEDRPLTLFPVNPTWHRMLGLERLTLTDPQPGENIFAHLSDALSELSLRDVPRYYVRRRLDQVYAPTVLLSRDAIRILETLPLSGALLRHLEITHREDGAEHDLLSLIAASCRNLVVFELHQYCADDLLFMQKSSEEVDISFDSLANVLSPLRKLQQLRLNFDLGLPSPRKLASLVEYQWQPFFARKAVEISNVMHWLDSVAFLTTDASGPACWSIWDLKRSPTGGSVEVEYHRFADRSVIDRTRF